MTSSSRMSLNEALRQTLLAEGENDLARTSTARQLLIKQKVRLDSGYDEVLPWLFPVLLQNLRDTEGAGALRVMCSDTLAICLLRTNQLAAQSPEFAANYQSVLLQDDRLDLLFSYIVDYWDESGAPLSNSLKDVFSKLVNLLKAYDFHQKLFQKWMDVTLQINPERRVLYYLIETLSKELEDEHYILSKDPLFIENALTHISSNALGNLIGKSTASILKKLYINEDKSYEWIENYWPAIKAAIKDDQLRPGVVTNLLPHLFKISKSAFKSIVLEFQGDVEIFITFLNIGQQLVIEEDPYPNLVDRATIERLLTHNDYKLKVFQILTFSPKGSKIINLQILEMLRNNLELFLIDVEVETRNEFISQFKQFLYRMKDSGYALNRDAQKLFAANKFVEEANEKLTVVQSYKAFLNWFIKLVKTQLIPGAPYQRVITGLKFLRQLVESNLDPNIFFKVDIPYAFQIPIFSDDELTRLLFHSVLSTYDDIREIATYLLVLSKPQLGEFEREELVNKSFSLLSDYGKSEAGAKFLQLCHSLFRDDAIFTRLLESIPLMSNISEAVKNPVDGYFHAMALILPQLFDKNYTQPERVIEVIDRNWENVKEILSNDSPEGCDQYNVGSAQLVLSYGWRSTKEASFLLTKLMENSQFSDEGLIRTGELALDQLSTVRHRGAFSSVYPAFIKLASICAKQIPGQNQNWLDFNISLIQTKTQLITRRSGGLPFLITAIVTVDRGLFKYAFERLLDIAKVPVDEKDESEKMDIPQVHAFNCIKTLFIEAQLSSSCAPYIYEALQLSLSTFSSKIWSVRNCSIMLFTALQNRLFGYKKMSARVFFSRFKGIKQILISILENSTTGKIENLEILFPVLTILSKLQSSPGYTGLNEFIPYLRNCLQAKYWKVRECASWALPALVPSFKDEAILLIKTCSIEKQNQLHGHLLAVLKLLKEINFVDDEFTKLVVSKSVEILIFNPSFVTKKAFLDILTFVSISDDLLEFLKELFVLDNEEYEIDGSKQIYLKALFRLICNQKRDDELLTIGLSSKFYEVKLEAIQCCTDSEISHPLLLSIAQDEGEWIHVRSKVIPLASNFSIEKGFEFISKQDTFGESIKCSGLELLGTLVAQSDDFEVFKRFTDAITRNSDDDEPFPVRFAALNSVLRFLSIEKSFKAEFLVYQFLSDDDDEIRELASNYFIKDVVPWISAKVFVQSFVRTNESALVIGEEVMKVKFHPPQSEGSNVVFSVEKKNLYRNNIEQITQLSQMLTDAWSFLSSEIQQEVACHIKHEFGKGLDYVSTIGSDHILGWGNDDELFEQLYIVFYLYKQHTPGSIDIPDVTLHQTLHKLLA